MAGLGIAADQYGPAPLVSGINYVVKMGDSLSSIAARYLGNSSLWREIWDANPQIEDPNKIEIGMNLLVPSTKTPGNTVPVSSSGPRMTAVVDETAYEDEESGSFFTSPLFLAGAAGVALLIVILATKKNPVAS